MHTEAVGGGFEKREEEGVGCGERSGARNGNESETGRRKWSESEPVSISIAKRGARHYVDGRGGEVLFFFFFLKAGGAVVHYSLRCQC